MKGKGQRGSVTVEAVIMIAIFLPAVMALLSLSMYTFTQLRVQQALNQTAKELSQYYYLLAACGLDDALQSPENPEIDEVLTNLNIFNSSLEQGKATAKKLANDASVAVSDAVDTGDLAGINDLLNGLNEDYKDVEANLTSIQQAGNALLGSIGDIAENPSGVLKCLAQTVGNVAIKHAVAAPLSKAIFNGYIRAGSDRSVEEILKSMGVEGDMNFWGSTLVEDGKSINVVVTYEIKGIFNNLFPTGYRVTQVASTAAWNGTSLHEISLKKTEKPAATAQPEEGAPDATASPEATPVPTPSESPAATPDATPYPGTVAPDSEFWNVDYDNIRWLQVQQMVNNMNATGLGTASMVSDPGIDYLLTVGSQESALCYIGSTQREVFTQEQLTQSPEEWYSYFQGREKLLNIIMARTDSGQLTLANGTTIAVPPLSKEEYPEEEKPVADYPYMITIYVPPGTDVKKLEDAATQYKLDTNSLTIFSFVEHE